jgi:methanogenic corrinoid protein MtbC1
LAFLRPKSVNARVYLYLVENRWDAEAGYPRQRVLRYLGPLEKVRPEELPRPFRTPRLEKSLARLQASLKARRAPAEAALEEQLFRALLEGNLSAARTAARSVVRSGGLEQLYGQILPAVFRRIGDGWGSGRISVAREHVATGIAGQVVEGLNASLPEARPGAPEAILCVPEGESHTLPLALAEGLLRRRGFRALNLAGSAPTADVVAFVVERRPRLVMISITQQIYGGAAWTLAARLKREVPNVEVVLGGQGFGGPDGSEVRREGRVARMSLAEFVQLLRPRRPGRARRPTPTRRVSPARGGRASGS